MGKDILTLDCYVKSALDFLEEDLAFSLELPKSRHTLVVGSQNGYYAGRMLYRFAGRSFSHAEETLAQFEIDTKKSLFEDVTIVSATGSRNVASIASYALDAGLKVNLITCRKGSETELESDKVRIIFVPSIEEPATVNISTYGKMIQGITHEVPKEIRDFITSMQRPKDGYDKFCALTMIFPDSMLEVSRMVHWKLNGENIGRQTGTLSTNLTNFMHGGAVTDAEKELYVLVGLSPKELETAMGVLQNVPEKRKLCIEPPGHPGPLIYLLAGYTIVGEFQKGYPAFQKNIEDYGKRMHDWHWISPVAETPK